MFKVAMILLSLFSLSSFGKAPKVYTFTSDARGFHTNTHFIDFGKEVVAIDSQFTSELAREAITFLKTKTQSKIKFLIITHPNPDKFNGMNEFQKVGAKVVASQLTVKNLKNVHEYKKYYFVKIAKMFTEETYPRLGKIDLEFEKSLKLSVGKKEIELIETGLKGVSSNQTIIKTENGKVFVGDLFQKNVHAWLEGAIENGTPRPSIEDWINNLKFIKNTIPGAEIYGGRGESQSLNEGVSDQINYLLEAEKLIKNYIRMNNVTLENASSHYQPISVEFKKAFPKYRHEYMIEYGAYGLVNDLLN